MNDFLAMARSGRVYLFGDGQYRLNPIHGADLAHATAEAIAAERSWMDVGGPDVFTHDELAALACAALDTPEKILHLPDFLRRGALAVLPLLPESMGGPARFFLAAFGMDMVGEPHGTHHLADHFRAEAAKL